MAKLASGYHQRAITAEGKAKEQQQTITDMQVRQRDVAALDAKYTGELADAKATIDQLQSDVAAGRKRLQLNATCKKQSTTGTASVDDATSLGLTDAAERDYFTLRERIATVTGQLTGLQAYVREQCLK
ncbi:lysis protein [Erwinia rhapontici]|uniref:lysis protein n=1 Tax=Erwinia rhapontici TaxID=55212 RepID=UPI003BA3632D